MRLLAIVIALAACGSNHGDATPDGGGSGSGSDIDPVPEVAPICNTTNSTKTYATAADFDDAVVPGTLANWDPSGRWFLTGVSLGDVSSVWLAKQDDGSVTFDRTAADKGTPDADSLFETSTTVYNGHSYVIAHRISNLRADGSLRWDRAECYQGQCEVCTAKMIKAEHNAGEGEGQGFTLQSVMFGADWGPGYTFNVRVVGNIAYLIRQDGLHIIDTTDPTAPVQLGLYRRSHLGYSNDVKMIVTGGRTYAVIADYNVDVVDVTDPTNTQLVATITEQAHTDFVEQRDGKIYVYFGTYDGTCPIYDLTNPASPTKLGQFAVNGMLVHDLSVENGIAYLNAWEAGFVVVDFTNPAAPTQVGSWPHTPTRTSHSNWTTTINGRHIALHGEENYDAKLDLVDVDPTSATFMQSFATWQTRKFISIHNLMAFGSKAYFSYYQDGIRVLDLSDPTTPKQVGYYNTWDPQADYTSSDFFEGSVGLDVDMTRHLVFVADSPRGLLILKDETP
ncbi:MAG: hypothetical protein QM831_27780 [Kofleriaceae bacterium]